MPETVMRIPGGLLVRVLELTSAVGMYQVECIIPKLSWSAVTVVVVFAAWPAFFGKFDKNAVNKHVREMVVGERCAPRNDASRLVHEWFPIILLDSRFSVLSRL